MNKSLHKILCLVLFSVLFTSFGMAQKPVEATQPQQIRRCATDEAMQRQYQTDPAYRAMIDQREREYQAWKASNRNNLNDLARTSLLTGPVTIPIVFHIVLPNPEIVTDADCEYVVNRLNLDFSGLNPDSTNGAVWYSVRGHSLIRFCLARRDVNGNFTSGIQRKVGTTNIAGGEPQPIKNSATATGGFSPWDVTKYYNVWVGNGGGLLGIAPAIGTGTAASDGVCVAYDGFSNNPCYTIGAFNLARTAVHEIGHNFGLFHTFQGGCADGDNGQLTSANCQLPTSILSLPDQSPGQSNATSGCPTVGAASSNTGCSGANPPGRQFQNYMDYTDDACYSMFNNTQVERMHWLLENCRAGYLTSNGCQLPSSLPALDGAITAVVNPGGSEVIGCTSVTYTLPTCPGNITPRVRVQNQGSTTLTSVTITYNNGGAPVTNTYPVNLAYGKSTVVVLGAVGTNIGANTFTATITGVNGGADAVATNNTGTANFTLAAPGALPRSADFVTATFPPPNFTNVTVAGTSTTASWVRNGTGNGGTNGSAGFNFYSIGSGNVRDLRTTPATVAPLPNVSDSIIVTFDVNYKTYTTEADRLEVLYSLDCGTTWLPTGYNKAGSVLATLPPSTAAYTTPTTTDWRNERIALRNASIAAGGAIQFAFRGTSAFGNWLYIDNINIAVPVNRDATITAINRPNAAECLPTFTPQVVVKNNGVQTINSYQVTYQLGANPVVTSPLITTPILPGASATVNLANVTAPVGNNNFTATVINITTVSGTGDQNPANDALSKPFVVRTLGTAPVVEGFQGATFPSAGWSINNPNNNNTWVRVTNAGGFGLSSNSMFIDNFNFNLVGQFDDLVSIPVNCLGADSIIVTFDLAHKNYPGFNDALAIGISNNCGATTFATSYNKSGATLATAGSSTANYTTPAPGDWRTERVAIGGTVLSTGNAIIVFRGLNGYGNNIFIDNINIGLVYRRDLQTVAAVKPSGVECTGSFTPSVNVKNTGLDTVKSFTASYSVDGGAPVSSNITGLNLAPGVSATYNLTPVSGLAVGPHVIRMYTSTLVTNGGTGDQFPGNDTTTKSFNILGTQAAPLSQDFQGTFPPANWGVNNPDNSITWTQANTGYNSTKSASVKNFIYTSAASGTRVDDLITPNLSYSGVDSVYLSFDIAAITKQYPGATAIALDSVEVLVSKDCGATYTTVFNKWGEDLQTVNDPNYSNTDSFVPAENRLWKNVKLNITGAAGTSASSLVVFFRNKSNNDNNVYLDNINLTTLTFPARLKQQGYLLYPSPFSGSFNVQHYLAPTDLRYIEVFNSRGQLVYRKQYGNGGANSNEKVDITREAAGIYQVKLGYTNKVIAERIIKTN